MHLELELLRRLVAESWKRSSGQDSGKEPKTSTPGPIMGLGSWSLEYRCKVAPVQLEMNSDSTPALGSLVPTVATALAKLALVVPTLKLQIRG